MRLLYCVACWAYEHFSRSQLATLPAAAAGGAWTRSIFRVLHVGVDAHAACRSTEANNACELTAPCGPVHGSNAAVMSAEANMAWVEYLPRSSPYTLLNGQTLCICA